MLDHGGNLQAAIRRYGIAADEWIDLSTGINPHPYPVPLLASDAWHRLPEPSEALLEAARVHYGVSNVLPVAGSQAAIQGLPQLRHRQSGVANVVVASPSYAEHAYQWQRAGHAVSAVPYANLSASIADCDVMVIVNPNNPTGDTVRPEQLLQWADALAGRGGWLIVDEAFGDVMAELSVASSVGIPGLIVLRSIGKFFGLAGLRLGFVAADEGILDALADELGPWGVSGPAQQIGATALADRRWQSAMQITLQSEGQRLQQMLADLGFQTSGCALFRYWPTSQAAELADFLAQRGIWIRQYEHGVRLGLPADENAWVRLQTALTEWKEQCK